MQPPDPVNTTAHGGTDCTVHVGNGTLQNVLCGIIINSVGSLTGEYPTLIVDARDDTRPLKWHIMSQEITIQAEGTIDLTTLIISNINVRLQFGPGPNTVLLEQSRNDIWLEFPDDVAPQTQSVALVAAKRTVLMTGNYDLTINSNSDGTSSTPFQYIQGQVALGVNSNGPNETVNSITLGSKFPVISEEDQHYTLNDNCLKLSNYNGSWIPPPVPPSVWMDKQLLDAGFTTKNGTDDTTCSLLLLEGDKKSLTITTGNGCDLVILVNVTMEIDIDVGAGNDVVAWYTPNTKSAVNIALGLGDDNLYLGLPLFNTTVDVGSSPNSGQQNVIEIYRNSYSCNELGCCTFTDIGPDLSTTLEIENSFEDVSRIIDMPPPPVNRTIANCQNSVRDFRFSKLKES